MSRISALILVLWLSFVPTFAFGAGLVPCGGEDEEPCQTCHVVQLVNGVVEWLVLILGTIAAIIIVYAGFKLVMSGGNQHAMQDAKELINNMLIGFGIVLAGWLLIDTGMKLLLMDGETPLGVWNQVSCTTQPTLAEQTYTPDMFEPSLENPNPYVPVYVGGYTNRMPCTPLPNGSDTCIQQQDQCRGSGGTPTIDTSAAQRYVVCSYEATGGGSGGSSSGGGYGGSCQVLSSGPCSVANLRPIFGARAEEASRICNKESGGNAIESRSDICCGPGGNCAGAPSFSGGYFQINILAHADLIPGCNLSSFFTRNGETAQGNCVRRNGNNICTGWSCSIVQNAAYNTCMQGARNPTVNLRIAGQLFASRGFDPWRNSKNLCSIP